MRTACFQGFVRAEPRDDEAGSAVLRAPTHAEEVLSVFQEGTDAYSRRFRELRAIRRLEQQVAVVRVPLRTRRRRRWIGSSWRCRRQRLRQLLAKRDRNGAVNCGGGHQKRSQRRNRYRLRTASLAGKSFGSRILLCSVSGRRNAEPSDAKAAWSEESTMDI